MAKRKRLAAKRKPHGKKKKTQSKRKPHCKKKNTHDKISLIPRGHFNSYLFCRGYSFCREVNSFAVTVVGHRTFEILFPKTLEFSTCGYS